MIKKTGEKLTSVKISQELLEGFRESAIKNKISIQKLVERSMFLYLTSDEFKNKINSQFNTIYTGNI